jgi:signal transduction histidine kinase
MTATSQPGALPARPTAAAAPVRVLLIEDNAGFAYFIRDILMRLHAGQFVLDEARLLREGLARLRRGGVDLVLLDLGLPDSAREETFAGVQAVAEGVPILVLTVVEDDAIALQTMRAGAQDYLVKDQVDQSLLVRAIRYALERARSEAALHQLTARLLELQDEERRRIARDLHDSTAQNLAALSMNLSILQRQAAQLEPDARALLAETRAFADRCAQELRTTAYLLHPPLLDELGLAGAVRDYADGFADRSGIRVDLELPPGLERLPREVETTLFRVMQESLTNIHRHSGSPTASIRFQRSKGEISMEVRDKGNGLAAPVEPGAAGGLEGVGVGIAGMRERLRQLGGRLEIHSGGGGTTVCATLPIPGGVP